MPSVSNILLQITGDSDDAQRALEEVARDLAVFGRETAEAEADVDTKGASAHLDELKAKLASFSSEDVSADVNVRIAAAQADLALLQAELDHIDGENVNVDINVRKDLSSRIGGLVSDVEALGRELGKADGASSSFGEALGTLGASFSSLGPEVAVVAAILASSLVAALAAVAASLAEAVAGAGALAVALGASLLPGIALGIGAISRFKATSDEAGTAAHSLKEAFGGFGDAFKKATAAGSDAVFRGLSAALNDLSPLVQALGPAFTRLGQAGGDAFRMLGKEFSSPAWQKFFRSMTDSLTKLTPLFARSFGAVAKIMANIATASMPFLIAGFRDLAKWLGSIAKDTSHIGTLRSGIGDLVDQLKAWFGLAKALGDVFLGFLEAAAPQGKAFVEWLTKGAEALADWEHSKKGREEIRQFFHNVLPLAKELLILGKELGTLFLQLLREIAPLLTPILHLVNELLSGINELLSGKHTPKSDAIREVLLAPLHAVEDVWNKLKGLAEVPINFAIGVGGDVIGLIRGIWKTAKGIVSDVINFVLHAPRDVLGVIRDIWRTAKGTISKVINFILHAPSAVLGVIRGIWRTAKGIVSDVISFVLHVPHDAAGLARALWGDVKGIISDAISFVLKLPGVGGLVSVARSIWDAINSALPDITIDINIPTPSIPIIGHASGLRGPAPGHLAEVGEMGRELMFIPPGADVFTAEKTRHLLRALADGVARPLAGSAAVPALAGGGSGTAIGTQTFQFITPGTGNPDPRIAMAQAALIQRQKGRR